MSPSLPCPKRARVATAPCGAGAPWASLPEDMVQLIGWRVLSGDLLDYIRFRAVCAHWSRSAARPGGRGLLDPRFHPRRWMLLPEGHGLYPGHPALGGHVRFLNLSTGALARLHLPLFHDHVLLGCTDGLLVLLRHRDPGDTAVRLLHPFTGDVAELPPLSSLLPQIAEHYGSMTEDRKLYTFRGFLSGVSAAVTVGHAAIGAITVVLVLQTKLLVAHATTGDQGWTLSTPRLPCLLGPMVSLHGNLYAVTPKSRNSVYICKLILRNRMPQRVSLFCHRGSPPNAHWLQLQAQSTWSNAAWSSCLLASMMPNIQTWLFTESPTSSVEGSFP